MKKKFKLFAYSAILSMSVMSLCSTNIVSANTNDKVESVSSNINIEKDKLSPVANHNNDSLRQIAENNNISLALVEKLNGNVDPDKALPNGLPIYLPQNQLSITDLLRSAYSNVPSSIKRKYYDTLSSANRSAKNWIAKRESNYKYTAQNGRYYGRFQLDKSYLKGDYSIENQERTANRYVRNRYGSWVNAKKHWQSYGWY